MRVTSEIWVQAYLRRCMSACVPAVVFRRGASEAGAIYIKVARLDGTASAWGPAPAGLDDADSGRRWTSCHEGESLAEADLDAYLARQVSFDPDLWIIEVEDREGRVFLEETDLA